MRSQIESGAELLARLSGKPNLLQFDENLFLGGLRNTDVVEICGEASTGKSLLISQILAKCVLPAYYQDVQIGGCNASAVLINADHHFQTWKLAELMSGIVRVSWAARTAPTALGKITLDLLVHKSLRNLLVVDCYDSEQFLLTLKTLDDIFLRNADVALLAIDGIAAYYWQDRQNNAASTIDAYVEKLLKIVRTQTARYNVATIYTRPRDAVTASYSDYRENNAKAAKNVDYRIQLRRLAGSTELTCTLKTAKTTQKMKYTILPTGIKWKAKEGSEG